MKKPEMLINKFKEILPVLSPERVKGQNGKNVIIGGSPEFTGAPYYSAISQLKTVI